MGVPDELVFRRRFFFVAAVESFAVDDPLPRAAEVDFDVEDFFFVAFVLVFVPAFEPALVEAFVVGFFLVFALPRLDRLDVLPDCRFEAADRPPLVAPPLVSV